MGSQLDKCCESQPDKSEMIVDTTKKRTAMQPKPLTSPLPIPNYDAGSALYIGSAISLVVSSSGLVGDEAGTLVEPSPKEASTPSVHRLKLNPVSCIQNDGLTGTQHKVIRDARITASGKGGILD